MAKSAALRQAEQRARNYLGYIMLKRLMVERDGFIAALIDSGRICEADALDHDEVEAAAEALLADWHARWRAEGNDALSDRHA